MLSLALSRELNLEMAYICQEDESSGLLICWLLCDHPEARHRKEESDDREKDRIFWKAILDFRV